MIATEAPFMSQLQPTGAQVSLSQTAQGMSMEAALCNLRVLCEEESHYQRFQHELEQRLNQSGGFLDVPDDLSLGELFEEIQAQIDAELRSATSESGPTR
jgi:hypothetical protein